MKRKASAVWQGDLKSGKGKISTESGYAERNANTHSARASRTGVGTNPEELIAAAHAGCFSMAFSAELGKGRLHAYVQSTPRRRSRWKKPTLVSPSHASHLDMTAKNPRH